MEGKNSLDNKVYVGWVGVGDTCDEWFDQHHLLAFDEISVFYSKTYPLNILIRIRLLFVKKFMFNKWFKILNKTKNHLFNKTNK